MFHENTLPEGMKDADKTDRAKPLRMESRGPKRTTAEDENHPFCGGHICAYSLYKHSKTNVYS